MFFCHVGRYEKELSEVTVKWMGGNVVDENCIAGRGWLGMPVGDALKEFGLYFL